MCVLILGAHVLQVYRLNLLELISAVPQYYCREEVGVLGNSTVE